MIRVCICVHSGCTDACRHMYSCIHACCSGVVTMHSSSRSRSGNITFHCGSDITSRFICSFGDIAFRIVGYSAGDIADRGGIASPQSFRLNGRVCVGDFAFRHASMSVFMNRHISNFCTQGCLCDTTISQAAKPPYVASTLASSA